jgi:hypothetical protein
MSNRTACGATLLGALLALGVLPASAHHSYAMFDPVKVETVKGWVKVWEMSNPHAYLWVYIATAPQKYDLYGFEAPGPQELLRHGWDKSTVKPGDVVTVSFSPLNDGRHGGNLKTIVLADGRTLKAMGMPSAGSEIHD